MSDFRPDPKVYSQPKLRTGIKQKMREPTGELKVFKEIFVERNGRCCVTGRQIEFHPISFMHVLSKGAYPKFRLNKENILMVIPEVHNAYDNGSRQYLLSVFPKAGFIYTLKDELRTKYYLPEPTV